MTSDIAQRYEESITNAARAITTLQETIASQNATIAALQSGQDTQRDLIAVLSQRYCGSTACPLRDRRELLSLFTATPAASAAP